MVPVQLPGAAATAPPGRRSSTASPGRLGALLEYVFAPIGFNWQISIALVPGLAAREVAVGALGTVYAMSAAGDDVAGQLEPVIASSWSLATACSLLAWYVFAPQCLSTLAVVKRETNSWRYPIIMAAYLFALAYVASFITYRVVGGLGVRSRPWRSKSSSPLIVVAAFAASVWKLMPARRRLRVLLALDALGRAPSASRRLARANR